MRAVTVSFPALSIPILTNGRAAMPRPCDGFTSDALDAKFDQRAVMHWSCNGFICVAADAKIDQ